MSRRLAAAALVAALAACSAPSGKTCTQTSDCGAGNVCTAGVCQVAVDVAILTGPSLPTAATTASFTFTSATPGAAFECRLDTEAAFAPCASPKNYAAVPEGVRTFFVRGRVGDNVTAPASRSWVVDVTGPAVNLLGAPNATQSQDPTFAFTTSPAEVGATFECKLDSGLWAACTSPKSYAVPGTLAPGPHTFYVRGRDALGNYTASPQTYPWNQAPETTITCAPLAATNRTTEKVAFGSNVGTATFECQLDTGTWAACTSPRAWSLTYATHTVSVRAVAGGVTDPTPATTTFSVTSSPLLYYNFESSGANGGALAGYTALLEGGGTSPAPPAYVGGFVFSHGLIGTTGLSFTATSSSSTGWVRIPGARTILSHDCEASDASYTISMYYQEPNPPNYLSAGFLPAILHDRGTGGGFQTYHGVGSSSWTTCYDTWSGTVVGAGCFTVANPGLAATHTFTMEYAYNASTQGNDLKVYFDGTLSSPIGQTTSGLSIFNPYQTNDLFIGKDWYGYIDAVRVYNTTKGGVVP